jgi:hypothetical protein
MNLVPFKWIGLAALVTGLSAGGVAAVSYSMAQTAQSSRDADPSALGVAGLPKALGSQAKVEEAPRNQTAEGAPEKSEEEIERKIDQLLRDIGYHASDGSLGGRATDGSLAGKVLARKLGPLLRPDFAKTSAPTDGRASKPGEAPQEEPNRRIADRARSDSGWRRSPPATANPIRELEAQLKLELEQFDRADKLFQNGTISVHEREQIRGQVLLTVAQLEGIDEDVADELDRLKLELLRVRAEREKAEAQREVALTFTSRNERLNLRKPGIVGEDDAAKAKAELKVATGAVAITEAQIAEVGLRIQQLQRRRDHIKQIIPLADRAKAAAPLRPVKVPPNDTSPRS